MAATGPFAWDIYAQELYHHGHGYPLWFPDHDPTASVVDVGDVGWLKKGGFMQLFNARKDPDQQPVAHGVPDHFAPFNPPNLHISGPVERAGRPPLYGRHINSVEINAGAEAGAPLPVPVASGGASFNFKCDADSGALLMFAPSSESQDIEAKRHIVNYIREHIADWDDFANNKLGYNLKEHEIMFVSGTTKTNRWAVTAFHGQYKKKQGSLTADLSSIAGMNLAVSISNQSLPNTYYSYGPKARRRSFASSTTVGPQSASGSQVSLEAEEEKADQCIFIHYFKVKLRFFSYRAMKAGAGPHELPPPGPDEVGPQLEVEDDSFIEEDSETTPYDPVNDLLDYILESNPEASMAIASDRDIYAMFKDRQFPLDIASAIRELKPPIEVDEHGVGTVAVVLDLHKSRAPEDVPEGIVDEGSAPTPLVDPPTDSQHGIHPPPANAGHEDDGEERTVRKHIDPAAPTSVHDGAVTALAYSPDGAYAASGSEDTTVIVWDAHENSAMYKKSDHMDTVSALAFSRDSRILATGSNDEEIIIWQVDGGVKMRTIKTGVPVHALGYTPDGSMLIAGGYDGSLSIYNADTYERMVKIGKHFAVITFIVFSPDGRFMATGGTESEAHVWELASLGQGVPKSSLQGHKGMVCNVAFSPDGRRIITASDDGSSRVWNAETGEALVILHEHTGPVWCVAFSADGKRVASGSSDSTVKICDSYSGERVLSLDGHDNMINAVAFSPGGKFIASAASDNTVRLWNAEDGSLIATFNEHSDNVTMVMFGPDDATLASGSHDGTVRIRTITHL